MGIDAKVEEVEVNANAKKSSSSRGYVIIPFSGQGTIDSLSLNAKVAAPIGASAASMYVGALLAGLATTDKDEAYKGLACLFSPKTHMGIGAMAMTMASGHAVVDTLERALKPKLPPAVIKTGLFMGNFLVDIAAFGALAGARACSEAKGANKKSCIDAVIKSLGTEEVLKSSTKVATSYRLVNTVTRPVAHALKADLEILSQSKRAKNIALASSKALELMKAGVSIGHFSAGPAGVALLVLEYKLTTKLLELYEKVTLESEIDHLRAEITSLRRELEKGSFEGKEGQTKLNLLMDRLQTASQELRAALNLNQFKEQIELSHKILLKRFFIAEYNRLLVSFR